jgi:5-methylthioribose kinase
MEDKTNIDISNNNLAHKIIEDIYFKEKVLELKYKFMNQTDALLHGDLHTGSIMINKSETFIIDPEFAFVGPFGFDIGALLANFISSYVYHKIITKDRQYKQWLLKTIFEILEMFDEKIFDLWDSQKDSALLKDGYIDDSSLEEYKSNFLKSILQDSVGFAGCKLARRIFGVAGVEEIRGIEDLTLRNQANELIFKIARKFVVDYTTISSVDDILRIIKNAR